MNSLWFALPVMISLNQEARHKPHMLHPSCAVSLYNQCRFSQNLTRKIEHAINEFCKDPENKQFPGIECTNNDRL